ncbi:MAG: hypothetical protein JNK82_11305 [Myxococcaceae bacterium]|nr:hypothetical protein [Myxococcaceae bacterium]
MSDARTLRLAHFDITPDKVEAFVLYQRTLLRSLMDASGEDWAGRFAFAHAKALKESKLDPLDQKRIAADAASFCGRRSALAEVKARIRELNQHRPNLNAKEHALLERAPTELARLEDLSELEATLGAVTLASFRAREVELLELHRAVASAEGRGHLHPRNAN